MEKSHNGPKHAKNYENNDLELIFLVVQLDKDLLIQHTPDFKVTKGL